MIGYVRTVNSDRLMKKETFISNLAKAPYDPVKDFAPVSQLAVLPFVLSVHPSSPAKSVAELINLVKAKN
jgi:tripartite-type tricarboxylate transporter receptor subunit TctC